MTYTEREIARLEGMKDGLIKKLVEECEEINDQIIALRKGTPKKKDSEIYFDRGYAKGSTDAIEKFNDKVNYLKGQYVDACNMCTKIECDVCAVNSIIEDLEQLKELSNESIKMD